MPKLVAIGGGEIGRTGYPVETTAIDQEIVRLSKKQNPKLLFIPTASQDSQVYIEAVQRQFGEKLGCTVDTLLLVRDKPHFAKSTDKIFSADIIYVGGGDTNYMLETWQHHGIDKLLKEAYYQNIVLSGISAGAICWFLGDYGHEVMPLALVDAYLTPHYDERNPAQQGRSQIFKRFLKDKAKIGLGIGDCTAIEIVDNCYRILSSADFSIAESIHWKNGIFQTNQLQTDKYYRNLSDLLQV